MLGRCLVVLLALLGAVQPQSEVGDSCIERHTNVVGKCTQAYLCTTAKNDYLQNGIPPTFCGPSHVNPIICCRDGTTILQTAPSTHKPVNSGDKRRVSERKCEEYSQAVTQTVDYIPLLPVPDTYTISAANCSYTGIELIVGGEAAVRGEFPHMAAIGWIDFDENYVFNCGGSLISPRFVLTAGHCTWDPRTREPEPSIVRLGDHNINPKVPDGASPVDAAIKRIYKHPDFKPPVRYNDIALLEFEDIEFDTWIRPACLWNQFNFGQHEKAIATGWGVNDTTTQTQVPELQKVSLSLLSNEYCEPLLRGSRNRNWRGFRDTQLCAGELRGKKDTCQGDSGSPLQVASNDNQCIFHVMGIVSFGQRCATGKPAIYTRVFKYISWIEGIVWPGE